MDMMAIRDELVNVIQTVLPDWQGYSYFVDEFVPPAFFVGDPDDWMYDIDFDGMVRLSIPIRYCYNRASERAAYEELSRILGTGAGTPYAAINDNSRLNGSCDSTKVTRVGRIGRYRSGGGEYLGAEQYVEIMAQ